MGVTVREETFAECWDDAQVLFVQHFREISTHQDIPLSINRAFYEGAAEIGRLVIVVARDDRQLVGYAVFYVAPHPHYDGCLTAVQDVFYVDPARRGGSIGWRILGYSEEILRLRGVQVVHHHVKLAHPMLGRLLERKGYAPVETLYSRRLDQEDV
jgi:GNAT superfamily N-acetyltransferase